MLMGDLILNRTDTRMLAEVLSSILKMEECYQVKISFSNDAISITPHCNTVKIERGSE